MRARVKPLPIGGSGEQGERSMEVRVVSATRALDWAREELGPYESATLAFAAGVASSTRTWVRVELNPRLGVIIRPPSNLEDLPELETWEAPPPLE